MIARLVRCAFVSVLGVGCSSAEEDPGTSSAGQQSNAPDAATVASGGGQGGQGGTVSPPSGSGGGDSGVAPAGGGSPDSGAGATEVRCAARAVAGDATMHFHHIHFNTADADADLEFFEKYLNAPSVEFCADQSSGAVTRATKTERGYFLYTQVAQAPDLTLNTYLEHVGWLHQSPTEELLRLVALGVTLWPEGRAQCAEAAAGQMACGVLGILPDYFFYMQAPSGARIEVARGPGPATSGFGHVHLIQGDDLGFYATVSADAYAGGAIDMVNHTDSALTEDRLATEMVVDTKDKPIGHIAYSTTDLVAARDRIAAAGITIEEDVSFKPEFGFESFFVRSPKGIWVEIVADTAFAP